MRKTNLGAILFGVILMFFAIATYFSGEPATQTSQGRLAIFGVFALGIYFLFKAFIPDSKSSTDKDADSGSTNVFNQQPVEKQTPRFPLSLCRNCGKPIKEEYQVCPYCGTPKNLHCPSCNEVIEPSFQHCPKCGHHLK